MNEILLRRGSILPLHHDIPQTLWDGIPSFPTPFGFYPPYLYDLATPTVKKDADVASVD